MDLKNPNQQLWPLSTSLSVRNDPHRWSPTVHVNQSGYLPAESKKAMVGYYLGSLGELDLDKALIGGPPLPSQSNKASGSIAPSDGARASSQVNSGGGSQPDPQPKKTFRIVAADSGQLAFTGELTLRPDQGFPDPSYQRVLEADFSRFQTPGEYYLEVPDLGRSFPFRIDERLAGAWARAYALGLYHQRCGQSNALPFTRFTHEPCHTAPAEVPTLELRFTSVNRSLQNESAHCKDNPRHTAQQLKDVGSSLYPFVNAGRVDVKGGHHDAGDYSKYTINSAGFIHHLVFAVDAFPGAGDLDNLGLPESGDGRSDLLQEAKWEADFLARMQDADGGFCFLVYPRDREYESDVLPDHGDPQVVFPKTTAATAAAAAALAQCASSPTFKRQFPEAAASYLTQAKKGWSFLQRALQQHGSDGAYQRITHYGDLFLHDDELAWAACELFLATGEASYHEKLRRWLDPTDPNHRRWGWWRLYEGYGCAIRSYAFALRTGRVSRDQVDLLLLEQCEKEVAAAGEDQLQRARQSAYGTSFPRETKQVRSAGWYFSTDAAFDLAVAWQLGYPARRDLRPALREALLSNLNYQLGANPVNISYLTGLGWRRQREVVHQYAQNDERVLPPSGIPLGDIQAGIAWIQRYQQEPATLSFPPDGATTGAYPFYDRWSDAFNLSQEFVILNQARALGCLAWLMAQTSLKQQHWFPVRAEIRGLPASLRTDHPAALSLSAPGLDLSAARIVWEAKDQEPVFTHNYLFTPSTPGPQWIEAEAELIDGRRVFGAVRCEVERAQ